MNNYKQTEIGQFPNNWGINIIEEVFQIKQGKQLSAKYRHGENEFSFLRTSNVLWGKLDLSKLDKMNFTEDEREKLALNTNDLLVCEGGEIGRTAIWKGEVCNCYYQNHIHRLRAKTDSVCEDFFMYWMMYGFLVGKLYFGLGIKTTIPNLSQSKLKAMPIPLPPLPEQRNIAFILSKIQSAIEIQEKIIKTTTELKKALMQKLFTEGLHNEPQKETEIGLVPESWEVVELGGLSENPKYGFTDSAAVKGIVKFLRITDIQENGVNWETVPFCNCPKDKIPNYLLKDKDIVFARIGATTGKSYIINDPPDAVFASYLIRLRVLSSTDANYLYYFFGTNEYWAQVDSHKGNNVKGGVNSSLLKKMKIPLPKDVKEQKEIAGILKSIDMKHNLAVKHQELFLSLFKTMLHHLMTGQIRVKDINFN